MALAVLLAACGGPARTPGSREPNPLEAPPVDAARVRSAAEAATWRHARSLEADLDGDGAAERVVLAADVTTRADGTPLWEDGHRWALFVEAGARRTLLYAAFVPNGNAEAAVLAAGSDGRRHVLVAERTPQETKSLQVEYLSPGRARLVSAAYYQVEQWLPTLVQP